LYYFYLRSLIRVKGFHLTLLPHVVVTLHHCSMHAWAAFNADRKRYHGIAIAWAILPRKSSVAFSDSKPIFNERLGNGGYQLPTGKIEQIPRK
jgi:hypothetical protein